MQPYKQDPSSSEDDDQEPEYPRVLIIGGGLAGLSCAYYLKKNNPDLEVVVVENAEPGGWVRTSKSDEGITEVGPRSFRGYGTGSKVVQLVQELGGGSKLVGADPAAAKKFICRRGGEVQKVGISLMVGVLLRMAYYDLFCKKVLKGEGDDEPLSGFLSRHFGKTSMERCIQPIVGGIYGADLDELSAWAPPFGPMLASREGKHRSMFLSLLDPDPTTGPPWGTFDYSKGFLCLFGWGLRRLGSSLLRMVLGAPLRFLLKLSGNLPQTPVVANQYSLAGGMGTLTDLLVSHVKEKEGVIMSRAQAISVKFNKEDNLPVLAEVRVNTPSGTGGKATEVIPINADHVVFSCPAGVAGSLLQIANVPDSVTQEKMEVAKLLKEIPMTSIITVSLIFSTLGDDYGTGPPGNTILPPHARGFGILANRSIYMEERKVPLLGIIMESVTFPHHQPHDHCRITFMFRHKPNFQRPENEKMYSLARRELLHLFKFTYDEGTRTYSTNHFEDYPSGMRGPVRFREAKASCRECTIPRFSVGHKRNVQTIEALGDRLPLSFVGMSYHGIGIPDVLALSERVAKSISDKIATDGSPPSSPE